MRNLPVAFAAVVLHVQVYFFLMKSVGAFVPIQHIGRRFDLRLPFIKEVTYPHANDFSLRYFTREADADSSEVQAQLPDENVRWTPSWVPAWANRMNVFQQMVVILAFYFFHLFVLCRHCVSFPFQLIPNHYGLAQSVGLDTLFGVALAAFALYLRWKAPDENKISAMAEASLIAGNTAPETYSNTAESANHIEEGTQIAETVSKHADARPRPFLPSIFRTVEQRLPWYPHGPKVFKKRYLLLLFGLYQLFYASGYIATYVDGLCTDLSRMGLPISKPMTRSLSVLVSHLWWAFCGLTMLHVSLKTFLPSRGLRGTTVKPQIQPAVGPKNAIESASASARGRAGAPATGGGSDSSSYIADIESKGRESESESIVDEREHSRGSGQHGVVASTSDGSDGSDQQHHHHQQQVKGTGIDSGRDSAKGRAMGAQAQAQAQARLRSRSRGKGRGRVWQASTWFRLSFKDNFVWWVIFGYFIASAVGNVVDVFNQLLLPPFQTEMAESVVQKMIEPEDNDLLSMVVGSIAPCLTAPWWEELVYRGYLLPVLATCMPMPRAILTSAVIFAMNHLSVYTILPLTSLGILWAVIYMKSKNLLVTVIIHALWNSRVFIGAYFGW